MYDKLGDLLNEALESGKIPENKTDNHTNSEYNQDRDTSSENCDKSGLFSFNKNFQKNTKKTEKKVKIPENKPENTAEIIKMHKYTENMHIPPYIQQALTTLDIVYPFNSFQLNKQYRKMLKLYHPDSKNTIQKQDNVLNNRQLTIDEITGAYKILKEFLKNGK